MRRGRGAPAEKPSTGCFVSSVSWRRRSREFEPELLGVPGFDIVSGVADGQAMDGEKDKARWGYSH